MLRPNQTGLSESQLIRVENALGSRGVVAATAHLATFLAFRALTPFPHSVPSWVDCGGAGIFLALLLRWSSVYLQKKRYPQLSWRKRWQILFWAGSLLVAASWSLISVATLQECGLTPPFVVPLAVILGVASGAVQAFGLDLQLTQLFILLILTPTVLALFLDHKPGYFALAIVIAIGESYLLFLSNSSFRFLLHALKNRDELERARGQAYESSRLAALGAMAAGIAHEINNPLQVIRAITELLRKGTIEIPRAASKIDETVDRMAKIIAGLRNFARVEQGVPVEDVGVEGLISEVVDLAQLSQRENRTPIHILPIPHDLSIECRRTEIGQVLINLINNALDAVAVVDDPWIRIEVQDLASEIELRVEDSGPGIPDGVAEKIMLPFFTTKEFGKGTGLGLSISKSIAEGHRGSLRLDKKSDRTAFILTLPKNQKARTPDVRA